MWEPFPETMTGNSSPLSLLVQASPPWKGSSRVMQQGREEAGRGEVGERDDLWTGHWPREEHPAAAAEALPAPAASPPTPGTSPEI